MGEQVEPGSVICKKSSVADRSVWSLDVAMNGNRESLKGVW